MSVPKLRFPEFKDEWEEHKLGELLERVTNPVDVDMDTFYRQIGIRSHGKGLFYKEKASGRELGNKKVFWIEPDCLILNIVFAWERAVARTTSNEIGMIASHRFPMFKPVKEKLNLDYITEYLITSQGQKILILASPGGAGRNKTLGIEELLKSKIHTPVFKEQEKIAQVIKRIDEKTKNQQDIIAEYEEMKRGIMQKIFCQEIRFNADDGSKYPDWEEQYLSDVLKEHKEKYTGNEEVYSVSISKGLIDQIEHLGRSYAADKLDNYKLVHPYDVVYTKSPTGDFKWGIVKQSKINKDVIVSPLYGVFTPSNRYIGAVIDNYFSVRERAHNYLITLVQKGAKNTINISNSTFLNKKICLPVSEEEQQKIASCLSTLDSKIEIEKKILEDWQEIKKGLLQQMFV